MKRTEMNWWGDGIEVIYDTDLFPFQRSLKPGETFVSANSGIALKEVSVQIPTYPSGSFRAPSVMMGDSLSPVSGQQSRTEFAVPLPGNYKVQILEIRSK